MEETGKNNKINEGVTRNSRESALSFSPEEKKTINDLIGFVFLNSYTLEVKGEGEVVVVPEELNQEKLDQLATASRIIAEKLGISPFGLEDNKKFDVTFVGKEKGAEGTMPDVILSEGDNNNAIYLNLESYGGGEISVVGVKTHRKKDGYETRSSLNLIISEIPNFKEINPTLPITVTDGDGYKTDIYFDGEEVIKLVRYKAAEDPKLKENDPGYSLKRFDPRFSSRYEKIEEIPISPGVSFQDVFCALVSTYNPDGSPNEVNPGEYIDELMSKATPTSIEE